MNLSVVGTGYVGLVTGACFAEFGVNVVCVDIDEAKIAALQDGKVPIYEPGLEELIRRNAKAGRLSFTTDLAPSVENSLVVFIAVGTPSGADGAADLSAVRNVAIAIARNMSEYKVVVTKSTVPPRTGERVRALIGAEAGDDAEFDVVSNPEFLREGSAIGDFMRPDRIVVGAEGELARQVALELYRPLFLNETPVLFTSRETAELTKYAANAMLATKISFMNELANMAEHFGADIEQVRIGIGSDPRIGYQFIYPGAGYGGSCFPKDVRALAKSAADEGFDAELLKSVEAVNNRQKHRLFEKMQAHYGADLSGKTIAVWGLSFKPRTDDMRDAPSRVLMEALWAAGASVRAYDPEAMDETRRIYPNQDGLTLCDSSTAALEGADALAILTEWQEFRSPEFSALKKALVDAVIFDGRNLYEPDTVEHFGLQYYAIGRGRV